MLATIYMTYSYTRIAAAYLRWPDAIHITPREKILEAYGKHHPPPELLPKEDVYTFGRRSRRWERFATEWFSYQAEEALRTRSTEPLVRKRLSSWFWEKLLMGWYIPRSGIKPPKPFSSEWDAVVKQAIAELKKKYTVEKLNRGGILFDNELPAISFGFLYFVTLFADRWTVLLATGKALFFFTDGIESDYVQGTLAGTIYLLLSSGILELTLTKFYEKHKRISMRSVAESEGPDDIIKRHRRALSKIYASELCRFLVFSGLILIITTACVITIGFKDDRMDLIYTYSLSAFGFAGLLLGLFTKLFITSLESTVNVFLTSAIVISIGVGVAVVRILASSEYAVVATAASGWLFAFGCIASRYSEKLRSVHYKVQVSPALTSSGQRHIGHHTTPATEKARSLLAAKLISNRKSCQKIRPSSSLGDSIRSRLQFILETMGGLPPSHLLRTAFPSIASLIEDLLSDFRLGQLKVFRSKEALQAARIGHAAISARPAAVTHLLYVFLPPKESETADEEDLTIILEALLHEVAEAKGMTHAAACIAEMFVGISNAWLKEEQAEWVRNVLPSRIQRQLRVADDREKASMWCRTKDIVASKACLNLEVDEIWNRKISHQDRLFLVGVARLWWDSFDESIEIGALPRNLAKYLDTAPMSIIKLLSAKCGGKQEIDLQAHASQCILASLLALNIQKLYDAENDKLERLFSASSGLLSKQHYTPTAWTRFFSLALDIQVSLFLALTADERFGREVASHTLLLRLPCAIVNWMSRGLLNLLQHGTLYRWDPAINNTLKQMERGLSRIHHYGGSVNGHHGVSCVETYHGATHTIVAVVTGRETNSQSGRDWLTVDRYALGGPKPPNWKPGGMKPVSRAFFEEMTIKGKKTLRISHEHIFDSSGNTCKSNVYVYRDPTSIVAQHRYVVLKAVDSQQWKNSDTKTFEGTDEHTFSQLHGNVVVTEATLRRKDAGTGKWVTIQAKYEYDKWGTPNLGVFHGAYPSPWKMIVEYAKSSRGIQDSPRFISVEIQREHEPAVVRTKFDYSHPQHVRHESIRVIPGQTDEVIVATPSEIEQDPLSLLTAQAPASLYSSSEFFVSGLISKPRKSYTLKSPLGKLERIEYYSAPYPTLRRREILWAAWRRGDVPAPFARDLDERFLRAEPLLSAYWWRRDAGEFKGAQRVLREQKHKLSAELQMLDRPVTRTHLQIRYSDLYILGCGGDAHKIYAEGDLDEENRHSIRQSIRENRANELLQVMNLDSGTWPTGGGGVGSCRRDLIHGLHRVRWTAVAELGSAELVQKDYPIEKHIDSIAYVPLWDLDFGTPNENIHRTIPYTTLQAKSRRTTNHVVRTQFVPLIEKLIKGCLLDPITEHDVDEYEKVFIDFHIFFLQYDWTTAWNHVLTQEAWIKGWLQDTWELWSKGKLLDPETPTLRHIEMMFDLIARLLMPLTVEIPSVPVVHASHHGIQAIIGVVAKSLHGSSLIVWDHGILWRERLFGLCTDEAMPKFVQIAFAGITRLVARVVFARADYITPCTSVQNVHWEAWLAGGKYGNALEAASMYARINPVLNGMDVTKFHPDPTQEPSEPTAIMLSHISPVKDVMNAINAARIIVRDFKLDTYRLHIYGSAEKDPPYTTECARAIANYGLEKHVIMKGLGSPSKALPTGSIFVNSSITEGLPLALGEAGLCGLPVVCTDVGGSREVIQDSRIGETFGWIVPPSRPMQLALAQMRVLTVTDGVANQTTKLDDILGVEDDGASLAARIMYPGVREMRRKLGMKLRERIMAVFSVRRYWREHEQILWLGPLYEQVKRSELPIS
ncbi:hypothetical protein SpCBS45565_g06692 [Spizellomyces sp. 'palustris']|nr:hypothetical protein SpCBS45565_g06692 [Spizellomyces sp. 'palustris']